MRGLAGLLLALTLCAGAAAQVGGWPAVRGIAPGSQVEVRLAPAAETPVRVKGQLIRASATGLEILPGHGAPRILPRPEIERVYLIGKAHKLRDGLILAGAGLATGAVVGYRTGSPDSYAALVPHSRAGAAAGLGALLAAAGAIIGAAIGLIRAKTLVYARAPASQGAGQGQRAEGRGRG